MNEIIATFSNDKNYFSLVFYDNDGRKFILLKDYLDNRELDLTKSYVYKFNITLLLISLDLEIEKHNRLLETGIEINIIERNLFRKTKTNFLQEEIFILTNRCLTALFSYLQREKLEFLTIDKKFVIIKTKNKNQNLQFDEIGMINNCKILIFKDDEFMYVNNETIKSLNIFDKRKHPNRMIKTSYDENSLFSKINFTSTTKGAQMLRYWLLFPLKNKDLIIRRQNMIENIIENNLTNTIPSILIKCKNVQKTDFFKDPKSAFININNTIRNGIKLLRHFPLDIDLQLLQYIIDSIETNIILQKSDVYTIKSNKFEYLDKNKELYNKLPEYLNEVAKKISRDYKITNSIVYFPQLGYVIETKEEISELDLKFTVKEFKYYKNNFMENIDKEIGDLKYKINNLENDIIINIINKYDFEEFNKLFDHLCYVDCLNSLAIAALKYNMTKPLINFDLSKSIEIKEFVNLTYCNSSREILPVDLKINKNTIITGHNGSGKSMFLKSIGTAVLLNQIGSFLPCKKANLSIFDRIFTKMTSIESVLNKRSAFLSDILQISNVFSFATHDSLLLVDEFGKGTNVIDGAALLFSVIKNSSFLLSIFTTHFQSFLSSIQFENIHFYKFVDDSFAPEIGICEDSKIDRIFDKLNYSEEFKNEFNKIKNEISNVENTKCIEDSKKEELNEEWAVKIINEFIPENN